MKKHLSTIAIVLGTIALTILMFSGITYSQSPTVIKPTGTVLKDTTIKNTVYKLYVGSRGGKYIIVTSKAGNQYKKYIKK